MIIYLKGNLLEAKTEALVNTVNTVGVMGKGIALQFKEAFPNNYKQYRKACKDGALTIGNLLVVQEATLNGEKTIVNFPTKQDWKRPSTYEYIESGLKALASELNKGLIKSIAIPPLGCGNGGLEWTKVRNLMENYLQDLPVDIQIFEPNESIKLHIQASGKILGKTVLTEKRAMLIYAMYRYELSMGENVNLFVANKLAYFLQRLGEPMRLKFQAAAYGPFTAQIAHVLYNLNGEYVTGLEQFEAKPFETLKMNYDAYEQIKSFVETSLSVTQKYRLNALQSLIQGFESFFALEVLATVDFIRKDNISLTKAEILETIANWSPRKKRTITEPYVTLALDRLTEYEKSVFVFVDNNA